jgi:hypothetical protein
MKILITLALIALFYIPARAQYALQIGKARIPIKTGDTISKGRLLSDSVQLLFLADTSYPHSGIAEVAIIISEKKGPAQTYMVSNNLLFPKMSKQISDTAVNRINIMQVRNRKGHIRPVNILLKLTE